ncbi:MAG: tRNA pseudouridine(38-40) synthase TruA, partial [Nitrospirae bacterium]|nr:tRNA pseudouridine(38-40) synthase TruA [Nitrospirota bacterium]
LDISRESGVMTHQENLILLNFKAESFLHHMVRNIVGTLVEVGKGKIPPETVQKILSEKDRRKAGPTAPGHGLWLIRVSYS